MTTKEGGLQTPSQVIIDADRGGTLCMGIPGLDTDLILLPSFARTPTFLNKMMESLDNQYDITDILFIKAKSVQKDFGHRISSRTFGIFGDKKMPNKRYFFSGTTDTLEANVEDVIRYMRQGAQDLYKNGIPRDCELAYNASSPEQLKRYNESLQLEALGMLLLTDPTFELEQVFPKGI